jgi:4'-phosphopantetheinyl transferase
MGLPAVQIYLLPSSDPMQEDLAYAWSVLDAQERTVAGRFVFERDRRNYLLAHGLLRSALARHTGIAARSLRFRTTATGRPELVTGDGADAQVRFNLSHTRGLVGCAISTVGDVGFDLETVRRPAALRIAERHFTAAEVASLRAVPHAHRDEQFYTLWVLKEAYIKARGLGLSLPLQSFQVLPGTDGRAHLDLLQPPSSAEGWSLRWWALAEHRAALAVDTPALADEALRLSSVESLAAFPCAGQAPAGIHD